MTMLPSRFSPALNAADVQAPWGALPDCAEVTYHPTLDVLTISIGRSQIEDLKDTWNGGHLTQRISVTMAISSADRAHIGIAEPRNVMAENGPEVDALRRILGNRLLGTVRAVVVNPPPGQTPQTIRAALSGDELTAILTNCTELVRDFFTRDMNPNHHVRLADDVGIHHDPVFSSVGRSVLQSENGVLVPDGDFTPEDIKNKRSYVFLQGDFPQRDRILTKDDIAEPAAPDDLGGLPFE